MIPKIIHYCWLSNDPIPEKLQKCMNSWREKLKGYKFILWNFERFDINTSAWVKQAFEARKYAFAADFIRLYAVYNYGGIYLDMDVEVIKPFQKLLNAEIMMAYECKESKVIEAGCFGAAKHSVYIKKCLEYYESRSFIKQDGTFDMLPMPGIMKKIMIDNSYDKSLTLYEPDYFTAKSFETGVVSVTDNTYCIHHFAESWTSKNQKVYSQLRKKIYHKFGYKTGKIIMFPCFLSWQIKDYGLKRVIVKMIKKIKSKLK